MRDCERGSATFGTPSTFLRTIRHESAVRVGGGEEDWLSGGVAANVRARTKHLRTKFVRIALGGLLLTLASACRGGAPPQPPPAPPYRPTYTYAAATRSEKRQDVTVAVIHPIVKGNVYGVDGVEMLKALPSALADLITAKGMRYRGPFERLDIMTFPDKRASDLGLYAELEVTAGWQPQNVQQDQSFNAWNGNTTVRLTCNVLVSSVGKVSFVVIEPMSGETVWRKAVPIEIQPFILQGVRDDPCTGPNPLAQQRMAAAYAMTGQAPAPAPPAPLLQGDLGNAYRRQLELSFLAIMKGIDTYMHPDEFAMLKTQSKELKDKKAY